MNKTDNSDEFLLTIVFITVILLLVIPACLLNTYWLTINPWFFWALVLLPLISILFAMILSGNTFRIFGKLPYIKYRPKLPLLFYYDEKPNRYRYKECEKLKEVIKTGDVLLRRHDHYIDGLILLQNAYYSHAGIAYRDESTGDIKVFHALGATGVTEDLLENFSRCDDLAVLRFNPGKELGEYLRRHGNNLFYKKSSNSEKLVNKIKHAKVRIPHADKKSQLSFDFRNVRDLVASREVDIMIGDSHASEIELKLFDGIIENIHSGNYVPPQPDNYIPLVIELARNSKGIPYDYDFNFQNFKTMSCVEFVWFCYKSLFPIHQVKRRVYTYFGFIKTFVLVPDLFVASKAFDLVYTGIPGVGNHKKKLLQHIKRTRVRFWPFLFFIVFLQLSILILFSILAHFLSDNYPDLAFMVKH